MSAHEKDATVRLCYKSISIKFWVFLTKIDEFFELLTSEEGNKFVGNIIDSIWSEIRHEGVENGHIFSDSKIRDCSIHGGG